MDNKRREKLKSALKMIEQAEAIIEVVYDIESDCIDNFPENLQGTERFEKMEDAVENLAEVIEKITDIKESIELVIRK